MLSVFRLRDMKWACENMITARMWHHVTYTWMKEQGLSVYVNGSLVTTNQEVTVLRKYENQGYDSFVLGRPNTNHVSFAQGKLDEIMFWDRLLDSKAIHILSTRV